MEAQKFSQGSMATGSPGPQALPLFSGGGVLFFFSKGVVWEGGHGQWEGEAHIR